MNLRRSPTITAIMITAALGVTTGASSAFASTVTAQPAAAVPAAGQARHERLADAIETAWNSNDATALANLFTNNGVYIDYAIGKSMQGRDQVAGWETVTHQLISNVHIQVLDSFGGGDHVAIESVYSGQIHGAPHPFAVNLTSIIELAHGKIASNKDYYNLAAVLAQSGLPADWTPPTGN
jgi:uncharacterized protein (TIGR02246 family)